MTQRHVQRPCAEYRKTGILPVLGSAGRPEGSGPSNEEVRAVLDSHRRPEGVLRTTRRPIQDGYGIRYNRVYAILKSNGLVAASPAKSRRRKCARYERPYSNAMWHTNWHIMNEPRMGG